MEQAPDEERVYPVALGRSLALDDDQTHACTERGAVPEGDRDAFASFQYKFQPASIDPAQPGLVSVDESGTVTVLRGTDARSDGGITFKGKLGVPKDTECLLIFNGTSFRLERCEVACTQLRHVRAAPVHQPRLLAPPTIQKPLPKSGGAKRPRKVTLKAKVTQPAKVARGGKAKSTAASAGTSTTDVATAAKPKRGRPRKAAG